MATKAVKRAALRLRGYGVVVAAVESGAMLGWRRAHKHSDVPTDDFAAETVARSVMEALDEVVDWERTG